MSEFTKALQVFGDIKLEHGEISNLQFNTLMIKEVLKNISRAVEWGILVE